MFGLDFSDRELIMFLAGLLIGAVIVTIAILIGSSFKGKPKSIPLTKAQKEPDIELRHEKLVVPVKQVDKPPEKVILRKAPRYLYHVPGIEIPFETLKEAVKQFPIDPKYYENPTWLNIPSKVRETIKREPI